MRNGQKRLNLLIVLSLLLVFLAGCEVKPESAATPGKLEPTETPTLPEIESETYTNSEHGFSLRYPKDWDVEEGLMWSIVSFVGPIVVVGEKEYMVSINVGSDKLAKSPKITLKDYARLAGLTLKKSFENCKKVDERSATISGLPAIVSTWSEGSGADVFMHKQAYFLKQDVGYVISYGAPPAFHDQYVSCFELAITSFKLK